MIWARFLWKWRHVKRGVWKGLGKDPRWFDFLPELPPLSFQRPNLLLTFKFSLLQPTPISKTPSNIKKPAANSSIFQKSTKIPFKNSYLLSPSLLIQNFFATKKQTKEKFFSIIQHFSHQPFSRWQYNKRKRKKRAEL